MQYNFLYENNAQNNVNKRKKEKVGFWHVFDET